MNWIHENLLAILSLLLNVVALVLLGLVLVNQNNTVSSLNEASKQMKALAEGAANKQDDLGPKIGSLDTSLNKIDAKLGQLDTKLNDANAKLAVHPDTKPAGVVTRPAGGDAKLLGRISSKLDKIDSRLTDIQAGSRRLESKTTQIDDAIKEMKKQARANRNYVFP